MYTNTEMAILRRCASNMTGTSNPQTIGGKLRKCLSTMSILRKKDGSVAGFGREGYTLVPGGEYLYTWNEENARQKAINW